MSEIGSSRLPGLLGKLGKMTSIRDTEVLEQSLLRTLGPLLGVLDTSLYRTDERQNLVRAHQLPSLESGRGRMACRGLSNAIEEVTNLAGGGSAMSSRLTDNVRLLGKPCTRLIVAARC